jgi:hypothetical protein
MERSVRIVAKIARRGRDVQICRPCVEHALDGVFRLRPERHIYERDPVFHVKRGEKFWNGACCLFQVRCIILEQLDPVTFWNACQKQNHNDDDDNDSDRMPPAGIRHSERQRDWRKKGSLAAQTEKI